MPGGPRLSRTQERAIAALLAEATIPNAAARAKVSERTLKYWLKQPAFAAEYRAARRQIVEHAIGVLQSTTLQAVATLHRNLHCGRPAVEVSAANSLLSHSLQGVEQCDLVGQIEALQELLAQQGISHENRNAFPHGTASNGQHPGR